MGKFIGHDGVVIFEGTFDGHDPGAATVRGPFSFDHATAGLENGLHFYTPTIGDVLLDAWFEVDVAFDGSSALADIGTTKATQYGLWDGSGYGIFSIANADTAAGDGAGLLQNLATQPSSLALLNSLVTARVVPAKFTTADPWYVWVSDSGKRGGGPVGGTVGAASLYIVTATPQPLP